MALGQHAPLDAELVAERSRHACGEHDEPRLKASSGRKLDMLDIVAGFDCGDFVNDQIGWIRQLAARHGNEAGIGKPVSLADADIDDLAFPDVEHPVIPAGDVLERMEETELAEHLQLLATELLDPEFVWMYRALVDECDAMPRPRKHGRGERSRKAATDDRDVCDDRRSRSSSARLGHGAIRRHG